MSTQQEKLKGIADAIREKKGTADKIFANDFATEIRNLPSGGVIEPIISVTPTEAKQEIRPSEGYDGIAGVDVEAIPTPEPSEFYIRKLVVKQGQGFVEELIPIKAGQVVDLGVGEDVAEAEEVDLYWNPSIVWQEWICDENIEIIDNEIIVPQDVEDLTVRAVYKTADGLNWFLRQTIDSGYFTENNTSLSPTGDLSIVSAWLRDGVTAIATDAFELSTRLHTVSLPMGVTTLGQSSFKQCFALKNIAIPSSVTSVGASSFDACYNLESVRSVTISSYMFRDCALSKVQPKIMTANWGIYTFQRCYSLRQINVPEGVTDFGKYCFEYCSNLKHVILPSTMVALGAMCFNSCNSLVTITLLGATPPSISSDSFGGSGVTCVFLVPEESLQAYLDATNWAVFGAAGRILPNTAENRAKFGVK